MNATCRADEEDFDALSQELQQLINYTEINKVVKIIVRIYVCDWPCKHQPCEHKLDLLIF